MISTFCNCCHAAQFVVFSPQNDTTPRFLQRPNQPAASSSESLAVCHCRSHSTHRAFLPAPISPSVIQVQFQFQHHVPTVRTSAILFQKPSSKLTAISRTLVYAWSIPPTTLDVTPTPKKTPLRANPH